MKKSKFQGLDNGLNRVCACMCVYVCVLGGEWNRVFASTALVVVWMAMYLTSYSDYVTGFHTPPSPP